MRLTRIGDIHLARDSGEWVDGEWIDDGEGEGPQVETVMGALLLGTPEELRAVAGLLFRDVDLVARQVPA